MHDIPQENHALILIRNIVILIILIAIILISFWLSFNLGKKLLMPVKKKPIERIEVTIPEPPPSIAAMQADLATQEAIDVEEERTPVTIKPRRGKVVKTYTAAVSGRYWKVQAGLFSNKSDALALERRLKAAGFDTYVVKKIDSGKWRVQIGAYESKQWAEKLRRSLTAKGFDSTLVYE